MPGFALSRASDCRHCLSFCITTNGIKKFRTAHMAGAGWSVIARQLNAEAVPTAHGGAKWYPSTVRAVVLGAEVVA